jgi:hypothetical protein
VSQSVPNPGLSPQQLAELGAARPRAKKIRYAIAVAKFYGWATAIFAGLTLIGGLFHWIGLVMGAGMAAVAYFEFRGATRLRQLDPSAAKSLALNHVLLGALLVGYAIYSIWSMLNRQSFITSQLSSSPELATMGVEVEELARMIGWMIYGAVGAVGIFAEGAVALFYLSRRKYVDAYVRETPAWIVDAQRAGLPM